jgi:hypothetical protein
MNTFLIVSSTIAMLATAASAVVFIRELARQRRRDSALKELEQNPRRYGMFLVKRTRPLYSIGVISEEISVSGEVQEPRLRGTASNLPTQHHFQKYRAVPA